MEEGPARRPRDRRGVDPHLLGGLLVVLRLLNPTDAPVSAGVTLGFPVGQVAAVRLDEAPDESPVSLDGGVVFLVVPAHALRSLRVRPG